MPTPPDRWIIHRYDRLESTNTTADQLAREGAPEGTSVVAKCQTAGRGRWGRSWESVCDKNLYISTIFRPDVPPEQVPVLALVAGLAAAKMLVGEYGVTAQVKWPNDIWISGQKAGGILAEMHLEKNHVNHVVMGLGLNVNATASDFSPDVSATATSLHLMTGKEFSIDEIGDRWIRYLHQCYCEFVAAGFGGMCVDYNQVMALKGEHVRIEGGDPVVMGIVTGVDAQGRLLLQQDGEKQSAINAGEVVRVCYS